jgi:hypothetical protein
MFQTNVVGKSKQKFNVQVFSLKNSCYLRYKVEKYGRTGHATDDYNTPQKIYNLNARYLRQEYRHALLFHGNNDNANAPQF